MTSQALDDLEKSVENAGTHLENVTAKLGEVENIVCDAEDVDDLSVIELLECVTEVKNEYQNLKKDIREVQQLQREMTNTLIYQRKAMAQTFQLLKKKIERKARKAELL